MPKDYQTLVSDLGILNIINEIGYDNTISSFNELKYVAETLGFQKTLLIAINAAKTEREFYIITQSNLNIICDILEVDKSIVHAARQRDDRRKMTIGFCIYFTKLYFGLTYTQIANALDLKVCYMMLNKYNNIIKLAKIKNPRTELDSLIAKYFYAIKKKIYEQIN